MRNFIKITLLTIMMVICQNLAFSQGEANVWYFGNGAGLNFNTNPPAQLEDGNANLTASNREGVGSMSDVNGSLLFYTDGRAVYNKNHVQMASGGGLLGGDGSSTQSGMCLKVNGSTTKYFIISTDNGALKSYYSIVDMTLSLGLGDVSTKNSALVGADCSEGVVSVPEYDASNNPTGENWIIFHDASSGSYRVYKTNGATITYSNTYTVGFVLLGQKALIMKTNACFNKIVTCFYNEPRVEILPFNNNTGVISAPSTILFDKGAGKPFFDDEVFGVEFSPNDQFLYVTESGFNNRRTIHQFDITLGTGINPALVISSRSSFTGGGDVTRFGHVQLAPNGRLYVPAFNPSPTSWLSEVPTPNVAWTRPTANTTTDFLYKKYTYNVKVVGEGLPVFSQDLLRGIKIYYNNACEGGTTSFSYQFGGSALSQSWNFGDPASGVLNTSTSATPTHAYTTAGTYTATLSVVDQCGRTRTKTTQVIVKTGPTWTTACVGACITINGTGTNASSYSWATNVAGPFGSIGSVYNYCGALPANVYVKDPTPLASYISGNSTAAANFGADIGFTYFELYTSATIAEFQVVARTNGANATFTIKSENLATTYWTGVAPLSVLNTTYTFNPNVTLPAGRYVFHTNFVDYAFRNNTDDDGGRDIGGVIDIIGENTGTKGGSFINIKTSLPDPCGVRTIALSASTCTPLGVELLDFFGYRTSDYNTIKWNTGNETNFNHFELEASTDGVNFSKVAEVNAGGKNSTYSKIHYTNNDTYYRLKIVDNDATYTYSSVIFIKASGESNVYIYPNPSSSNFNIFSNDEFNLRVFTIDGKLVYEKESANNVSFGDEFAKGMYVAEVIKTNGTVTRHKVVKE